jgi:bacterioferritin (cytochrome b1)
MDKDKAIALLNEDLEGEHAAVVHYLLHVFAMAEREMGCEISPGRTEPRS